MKKPVVLVLENSIDVTGALTTVAHSANSLGVYFNFCFVVPRHSKAGAWLVRKGFSSVYELSLKELSKRALHIIRYIPFLVWNTFRLKRLVKEKKVSLLHVNDVYNMLPVTLHLVGCNVPYVCHIRFLPDRFPAWLFNIWMKLHLRYAHKIVVVSKRVLNQLPDHSKIELVYDEPPVQERYPAEIETGRKPDGFIFLYLSNYMKGKGQDFALTAFAQISHDLPEWKLRFTGGDMGLKKNKRFRQALQERAAELNISHKIEWAGFTDDVEKEYKHADVVLNFSESESFSLTCAEALFFGKPLIATDCGGPAEIVEHNKTGIIVPNRDVETMATAMKRLAQHAAVRKALGREARVQIRKKFSHENTSLCLKKIYDDALAYHV